MRARSATRVAGGGAAEGRCWPRSGGGSEKRVGRVAAAVARSAVFHSAVRARSAARAARRPLSRGLCWPRSGGGVARSAEFFSAVRARSAARAAGSGGAEG
eukprot:scaffold13772_cov79-Phaeocystis_antarctica.AAC.1